MSEIDAETNDIWLEQESLEIAERMLVAEGLIPGGEQVVELLPAGDGNMNVTLRAKTTRNSFVLKQSRPFVAKYSTIPAPIERIEYEAKFYELIRQAAIEGLTDQMPSVLRWLPQHRILILEDLGTCSDGSHLYSRKTDEQNLQSILSEATHWLRKLHSLSVSRKIKEDLANKELRKLNHEHIFDIPFQEVPAIDLDSVSHGLNKASLEFRVDAKLKHHCLELGKMYLGRRSWHPEVVLHGDFYPGSWLLTSSGMKVIDPEFCFVGPPEFDLGILLAHAMFLGADQASSPAELSHVLDWCCGQIQAATDSEQTSISWTLTRCFAGAEILRRLLGVAQLPLVLDTNQRVLLCELARSQLKRTL